MFDKKLFRDKALEKLSSPENFDVPVKILSIKSWIILIVMFLITASILLWMVFSRVNQEVESKGLIVAENRLVDVHAIKTGFIENVRINTAENIKRKDILMDLISPEDKEILMEMENKSLLQNNKNPKERLLKNDMIYEEIKFKSAVLSPVNGVLFELKVSEGNFVNTGDKLLSIEQQNTSSANGNFEIIGFVSGKIINSINKGSDVLISPNNIDVKEFGYILGSVKRIAGFPVSQERKKMLEKENSSIAESLRGEVFEIQIVPKMVNNMLVWSSNKTPGIKLTNGNACNLKVIINDKSFLSYIF